MVDGNDNFWGDKNKFGRNSAHYSSSQSHYSPNPVTLILHMCSNSFRGATSACTDSTKLISIELVQSKVLAEPFRCGEIINLPPSRRVVDRLVILNL